VPAVRRSQDAQPGPDWRYPSKSQAASEDTSDVKIFPHDRLQISDIASVIGTLGSIPSVQRWSNYTFRVTILPLGPQWTHFETLRGAMADLLPLHMIDA
jgi:hypothetical protein